MIDNFKKYINSFLVGLLIIGSTVVWDYVHQGDWIRIGKIKWLFLFSAIFAGISIAKKWCWELGVLFFLCIFSYLKANGPAISFIDLACISCVILVVPKILEVKKNTILDYILISCALNSVIALAQLVGYTPFWPTAGHWVINPEMGFMGHPTMFGPLMVSGIGIALYRGLKSNLWLLITVLWSIQVGFTASVMSVVSLGAVILLYIYAFLHKKWSVIYVILCILSCVLLEKYVPRAMTDTGRVWWWNEAYLYIKQSPWLGYGIGTWMPYAADISKNTNVFPTFIQMHNDYIQVLFELGLVGLSLVLLFMLRILRGINNAISINRESLPFAAMFIGTAVNSLGNFPMRIAPLALIGAIGSYYFISRKYLEEIL